MKQTVQTHKWVNVDNGTVGWHKCEICGLRWHFPQNVIAQPNVFPPMLTCKERQKKLVPGLLMDIIKMLHRADANTATMLALIAKEIRKRG